MVKHSARPYGAIFHSRTLRPAAGSGRIPVAGLPGTGVVAGANGLVSDERGPPILRRRRSAHGHGLATVAWGRRCGCAVSRLPERVIAWSRVRGRLRHGTFSA